MSDSYSHLSLAEVEALADAQRAKRPNAVYLGDGLYADCDGYQIELYASNGIAESDHVFLDTKTLAAFEAYVAKLRTKPKD